MWSVVTGAYAVLLLVVSVIPVKADVKIPHLDKVVHLCEYLVFAWILVRALPPTLLVGGQAICLPEAERRQYLWWAWIYATSYGLLIELIQAMLPWRSAELADAVVNAIGAALGVLIGQKSLRRGNQNASV